MQEGMETPQSEPEKKEEPVQEAPAPEPVPEPEPEPQPEPQYEQAPPPEGQQPVMMPPPGPEPFMSKLFMIGLVIGLLAILIDPITWWLIGVWGIASLEAVCTMYLLAGIFTLITFIMMILVFLKESNKLKGVILLLLFVVSTLIMLWPYIVVSSLS